MSYQPIENYGVIGDLHTVALVGMNGSIDFMCAPRFDSPSVVAALLDDERVGDSGWPLSSRTHGRNSCTCPTPASS